MNKNEKKALFSFLSIYVGSAIFLIGVMLYIYYNNELKKVADTCSMQMNNASMHIKSEIINSHIKNRKFNPRVLNNENLRYALYDKDKNVIFSYLEGAEYIDFSKQMYEKEHFNFYISSLDEDNIDIKYIVIETCQGIDNRDKLKVYVIITLILSAIFIGFIGYLLSKILLKPIREKVEDMDKFIKDSAHELNTPISVLMTSVSMLKNGKNPEKMMKYILSSSKQISQIYNDIHFSAFNDLNDKQVEDFNLKDLVSYSAEYFNDISITKNISIETNLEDCRILMDKTKAQKIVNNLISNAIKYSNKNSKILVNIKDNILSIEDFGIGISKKEQNIIFKRYKRGNNIEGGFGIGLDIVKRICDEYNIIIRTESKVDIGSTFYIDFSSIVLKHKRNKND
ncbi:MAG: sensor histidine kinase [Poseidonibacter sp.]|uniref:sensor histidine kinase n=1 Tax=Poseidonibacter sp. TaxID=2321188 RepID=UPI00359E644C